MLQRRISAATLIAISVATGTVRGEEAAEILEAGGVQGGLVVHLGCGDGKLTAELRATDGWLVHGLDTDPAQVARARKHIQSLGLYGKVAVDRLRGSTLPYADNLVNLIVARDLGAVPMGECMRVLAPRGVVCLRKDGRWTATVKPEPEDIDEWTHDLHDAGGNPVARDRVAGPPRHLQWTAGPLWARSHGWTPSVSAMVSSSGRLFALTDETLTGMDGSVPGKWFLVARDAFSGVLLWKRSVSPWGSEAISGTPDTGRGITTGRFTMPTHLGKRLIAVGDTVYVTPGAAAPVTALDAATGRTKRVYEESARADEVLVSEDRLIVSVNPPDSERPDPVPREETPPAAPGKHVCVLDVETGRLLWKEGPFSGIRAARGQDPFGRLELAAGDGRVLVLTTGEIVCLDVSSGEYLWRKERPALPESAVRRLGFAGMYEYLLTVLVYSSDVVLLAQPEPNTHHTYHTMPGTLYAFDATSGRQLWKHAYGGWGHCTPPDVFVVDDTVWTHVNPETEFGSVWGNGYRAKDPSRVDYRIQALDLRTGRLRKEIPTKDIFNVGHHHRCYRNRITERYLIASRRGVEFVDLATGENFQNHWVRSGCLLGNLLCNGLVYTAPHPCACYLQAKLTGFNALATERALPAAGGTRRPGRLERAMDPDDIVRPFVPCYGPDEWPAYRHDSSRSGATESPVNAKLSLRWQVSLDSAPSGVVVADDTVVTAAVDAHTVHARKASDGAGLWSFTAGARVNSPPTLYSATAIFGSADGRVYCLSLSSGRLIWRFDAAPGERLVTAFDQLESAWPVPGSVVVHDGKCWFAAGRSTYLDEGIHVYALDAFDGVVLHHDVLYSPDPETGKMKPSTSASSIPGVLNDVPAAAGGAIYIRGMQVSPGEARRVARIIPTGGFLDASWFNRTFWTVGKAKTTGLMVLGDEAAYGVEVYPGEGRDTVFKPASGSYRILAIPLKPAASSPAEAKAKPGRPKGPQPLWQRKVPVRITAMVRAGDHLFAAGSPDTVDPTDPHGAWEGRKGGRLVAFSTREGKKLAEYRLRSPPVWDGMAATRGRLYLALHDGTLMCFEDADH